MQTNQPANFFAAYKLNAIPDEPTPARKPNLTPYLQALLAGQTRAAGKPRVFPMVNPYPGTASAERETGKVHRQPWKEKQI